MDIHYTLLMDIYDILLMVDKHKFVMSYNEDALNRELKYDIIKRYKMWLKEGKPLFMNGESSEDRARIIDTYELLCYQPQYVNCNGSNTFQTLLVYNDEKLAIKMIKIYGIQCLPQ